MLKIEGDGDELTAWEALSDLVLFLLAENGNHDGVIQDHEVSVAG
jgi:hypothetical protein